MFVRLEEAKHVNVRHGKPRQVNGWGARHYCYLLTSGAAPHTAKFPHAPFSDCLAADLGKTLSQIHSVPIDDAYRIGLSQADYDKFAGTLRFLHGDFSPDNIMVDRTSGRLQGVIDWGSAMVGDPALDFIWLVLWRGWTFTQEVIATYELPVERDFIDRVKFHAQVRALEWLSDTIKRRGDPEPHLTWLRNAFSLEPHLA